jgi:toxin ParE1/3/4
LTTYPVRFRAQAQQDLKDIYDWIVTQSLQPQIAENFINRIYHRCETLGHFPLKGPARDDLGQDVRILSFERKAVIVYRVLPTMVEISNIFYGGRDWEAIMSGMRDDNLEEDSN